MTCCTTKPKHAELATITVDRVVEHTPRALLVEKNGEAVWLPISQVRSTEPAEAGVRVTAAAWLLRKCGLI